MLLHPCNQNEPFSRAQRIEAKKFGIMHPDNNAMIVKDNKTAFI